MEATMRNMYIGLLGVLCLLGQNLTAAAPVPKQLKQFRPGAALEVHMANGRTLKGKLVSTSGSAFELLESDQVKPVTIECADVTAIDKTSVPKKRRDWIAALMV